MKNKRIRKAMADAGINQSELAEIIQVSMPELSNVLKYELAVREQNEIVKRIREWDAMQYTNIPKEGA